MLCKFCQTEYPDNLNRCPNCGMRDSYDTELTAPDAPTKKRQKIWHNPFYWFASGMGRWASFKGRARRVEYFYFMFFAFSLWLSLAFGAALMVGAENVDTNQGRKFMQYGALLGAGLFVMPMISLVVRRLHDIGLSGWHFITACTIQYTLDSFELELYKAFIPLILLFWPGSRGENPYGPDPRYAQESAREKDGSACGKSKKNKSKDAVAR